MQKIVAVALFFLSFCGCHVPTGSDATESGDKILFLAYELNAESSGSVRTRIIHQILSDGTFKPANAIAADTDDLIIQFLDKKDRVIKTEVIYNPFIKKMESVNDEGRLVRVTSVVERAEVTVRTRYDKEMKKIIILQKREPDHELFRHDLTTN